MKEHRAASRLGIDEGLLIGIAEYRYAGDQVDLHLAMFELSAGAFEPCVVSNRAIQCSDDHPNLMMVCSEGKSCRQNT